MYLAISKSIEQAPSQEQLSSLRLLLLIGKDCIGNVAAGVIRKKIGELKTQIAMQQFDIALKTKEADNT